MALSPSFGTGARLQAERCQFPETVARSQVVERECGENPAYERTHGQTHPVSQTDRHTYVRAHADVTRSSAAPYKALCLRRIRLP